MCFAMCFARPGQLLVGWVTWGCRTCEKQPLSRVSPLGGNVARILQLLQCLLNIPLQQQNTLAFERPLGVAPAFLPQRP
jgi:hypothetical protein